MEQIETDEWRLMNKQNHADWVYKQELKGIPIHKTTFQFGPKHPESYLLYNDSGILIFPRNHIDLYSSYTFWLEHLCAKEPIESLGKDYFSSRELGVTPELIEELYELQQKFIINESVKYTDRMNAIQKELQEALIKIEDNKSYVNN